MVTKIFQLLLLISPIAVGANVNPEMFDMIFFRIGIIVLFAASLLDNPKREMPKHIKWAILSLLGLCLANVFINTFAPTVMMNFQNLFLAVVGFYIVYIYWDEKQNIRKYILWAGLINLLFFICQQLKFDPVFDIQTYAGEEGAFLGNKQRMMTYFALLTPFLWTPLLMVSLLLGLYTKQIIIFIPIAVMLLMKAKSKREKISIGIITFLMLILLKDKILYALSFRFNTAWKPALQLFFDRPLLGYGLGIRPIPDLEVLGNSYLQFIMGVGILGAVWFGYIFRSIYKKIRNNTESIALISLAMVMFVEYVCEIPRLWFTIIAILTMFLIKQNKIENV